MDRLVFIQQSFKDLITAALILKPEVIVLLRLCRPNSLAFCLLFQTAAES